MREGGSTLSPLKKYSFAWVTLGFLAVSLLGHWLFGWFAYLGEQQEHGAPVELGGFVVEMLRDTFENWQSEFLQLLWQVVGLTILLHVGSPQSKDSEDRTEALLEAILKKVDPKNAGGTLAELEQKFPKQ
jgi:hypothetical protein